MALSAHQVFCSSLVRLWTCPRGCLKWACLDAEFLSLSQAAWAERFASINVRISWSFWSNQSRCLRLQKPRAVSAAENTASLNTVQACSAVWVSTGRAGSSSHNFSCSSLWMPVHLSRDTSSLLLIQLGFFCTGLCTAKRALYLRRTWSVQQSAPLIALVSRISLRFSCLVMM